MLQRALGRSLDHGTIGHRIRKRHSQLDDVSPGLRERMHHRPHDRIAVGERRRPADLALQLILRYQLPPLQRPGDQQPELSRAADRLLQVIEGAELHRPHGVLHGPVGGEDDDLHLGLLAPGLPEQIDPVERARHLEIGDHQVEGSGAQAAQRRDPVRRRGDLVSVAGQGVHQELPDALLVVHHENRGHAVRSAGAARLLQGPRALPGRGVARGGALGQRPGDHRLRLAAQVRPAPAQRRHRGADVLGEDLSRARAVERRAAGQHLVYHHREAVDVAPRVELAFARRLLRRDVVGRSHDHAGRGAGPILGQRLGDAEVGEQAPAGGALHQDVVRLHVAVDHAGLMREIQGRGDVPGDVQDQRLLEGSLPAEPG